MKNVSKLVIVCLVTAAIMRAVEYANRMGPLWAENYYNSSFKAASPSNADDFEALLRKGCYNLIESEGKFGTKLKSYYRSVFSWLTRDRSFSEFGYGEYALLLHYSYLYALDRNDTQLMQLIREKFDKGFRNGGGIIERQDQIAYGNVAIDLYNRTGDIFYKKFADRLFSRLDSLASIDGLILYREGTREQHVDAIGLVCPFLFYYARTFSNNRADELGNKMTEEYVRWGTDDVTGIPAQTYDIESHVKMNHANWGRGISWFLMGIENMTMRDSVVSNRISTLEHTLLANTSYLYNQYFSQGDCPDISATIPVLLYLKKKNLISIKRGELAKLIAPYCDADGILRYSSPSIAFPHEGVSVTIKSLQSQAMLLYMLGSLCK